MLGIVYSLVSVIKVNCSLHVIKHLSTLCKNFSTESILEKCIQTVHVLIGEDKMYPTSLVAPEHFQVIQNDIYKRVKNTFVVTTPRSIYDCDICGAWLFVHKVPFTLQENVKTTKTEKTRFFFAKKMLHDKQLLNKVPF